MANGKGLKEQGEKLGQNLGKESTVPTENSVWSPKQSR